MLAFQASFLRPIFNPLNVQKSRDIGMLAKSTQLTKIEKLFSS